MPLIKRFRAWFDHEQLALGRVLESLESVPADRRDSAAYGKACDLVAHLCGARMAWLFRLGGAEDGPRTWEEIFPTGADPATLPEQCRAMGAAWSAYLAQLEDADLERTIEYTASEGARFRDRVENVLAQLQGHGWYHRGQIASLVKSCEGTPAVTDLVFFTREKIS